MDVAAKTQLISVDTTLCVNSLKIPLMLSELLFLVFQSAMSLAIKWIQCHILGGKPYFSRLIIALTYCWLNNFSWTEKSIQQISMFSDCNDSSCVVYWHQHFISLLHRWMCVFSGTASLLVLRILFDTLIYLGMGFCIASVSLFKDHCGSLLLKSKGEEI